MVEVVAVGAEWHTAATDTLHDETETIQDGKEEPDTYRLRGHSEAIMAPDGEQADHKAEPICAAVAQKRQPGQIEHESCQGRNEQYLSHGRNGTGRRDYDTGAPDD